jgi:YHS domain-containing protein
MSRKLGLLCLAIAVLLPPSVGMSQQVVQWQPTLEDAQRLAGQTNRLVLIYFSGRACGYCRRLEAEVLNQPSVVAAINADYVAVRVVADDFPATARRYGITNLPTTLVATPQGQVLNTRQGFMSADEYVGRISQVAAAVKSRRESLAQVPPNTPALSVSQPVGNQPAMNQPVASQTLPGQSPPGSPVAMTRPLNNQATQTLPPGQPAFGGPTATTAQPGMNQPSVAQMPSTGQPPLTGGMITSPSGYGVPGGAQPADYGQSQRPIAGQPIMPTLPQGPQPSVAQSGIANPPQGIVQPPLTPSQNGAVAPAPIGNPAYGLDGFCPVSLCEREQWVKGDPRFGANHRGRIYLFAGAEEQRKFFQDPDKYAPVASGNDVVFAVDQGQAVAGLRQYGLFVGKRVYLFSSEATLQRFMQNRNAYITDAVEANRSGSYQPRPQWR